MLLRRLPVWAPPALLALLLGGWHLGRPLLWRDELASWSAATRSTGRLWALLDHVDAVSGTYYLFLHYWVRLFGDSAISLRLPSVLATAATAGLTAAVGRRLFGARAGLWAGLLFAVVPTVLRYAQEARAYAIADAAVLLATWQLVRLLDCDEARSRPRMWLEWLGYAASLVLVGLLHLVALTVLLSHLWLLVTRRRGAWRGFVPATTLAGLALVPLALVGERQSGRQINWVHRPSLDALPNLPHDITSSWALATTLLVLSVIGCLGRDGLRYLPVPVLPFLAIWLMSQGAHSYWVDRYLLFVLPLWTILAALGAERLPVAGGAPGHRWAAPAAVLLVAALAVPTLRQETMVYAHTNTDWRGAATVIADGYRADDAIVPERGGAAVYMADLGVSYYLPSSVRPLDLFAAVPAVERNDLMARECMYPTTCLRGTPRIWVVTFGHQRDPLSGLPPAQQKALRGAYAVTEVEYVKGLTIGLLAAH